MHRIEQFKHFCHKHYDADQLPEDFRRKRAVGDSWSAGWDTTPINDDETELEKDLEDLIKIGEAMAETMDDEQMCFPVPFAITKLCEHVEGSPTTSVIVLVAILLLLILEILAVVCGVVWLKRGCSGCRNSRRGGEVEMQQMVV